MARILVACEYSGRVRQAFRAKGHEAWSIDLLPADDESPYHIKGDVIELLDESRRSGATWDMLIGFPPCTYLCLSGVRWLYKGGRGKERDPDRWENMRKGAEFFKALLYCSIPKICIENPLMHGWAKEIIGIGPTQIVQPHWFNDPEKKATGLYLKNLPPLQRTHNIPEEELKSSVHSASPGPDRWKIRSTTFRGIARAMAEQWSDAV